jgi:phosphate transport system substrate-binding protein
VKFNRAGAVVSLLTAGALVLAGCGSATHASSSALGPAPVHCGGKKQLKASGAAAQENAMEQFVYAYVQACPGYTLDYNANGSGAGVTDFVSNVSDLAGSGDALDPSKGQVDRAAQRCGSPAWDLPTVFEPIAVTYNVNGVNSLKLDASTLAKIFNGGITRWDDPSIKVLNPGTTCRRPPFMSSSAAINPVTRPTSSNTSLPHPTARGVKVPARRSTGESATAASEMTARRRKCRARTGRSPTTSGRSRWASS